MSARTPTIRRSLLGGLISASPNDSCGELEPWDDLLHHDEQGESGDPAGGQSLLVGFNMRVSQLERAASDARLARLV